MRCNTEISTINMNNVIHFQYQPRQYCAYKCLIFEVKLRYCLEKLMQRCISFEDMILFELQRESTS